MHICWPRSALIHAYLSKAVESLVIFCDCGPLAMIGAVDSGKSVTEAETHSEPSGLIEQQLYVPSIIDGKEND